MNKGRTLLLVLIICWAVSPFCAVNHMDLMTTLTGEFTGSCFGRSVVSLDFNGDGYEDLVVASHLWNPTGAYSDDIWFGKIYFYWGGPGFDNIPDYVIEGDWQGEFGSAFMCCAGDVNNDGFDDLIIPINNPDYPHLTHYLAIFLGTASPHHEPDIIWIAPGGVAAGAFALGDINLDDNDDLSIMYYISNIHTYYVYIWDNIEEAPYLFCTADWSYPFLNGIGDTNGDGYDDCHLNQPIYGVHNYYKKIIYFGQSELPLADSLVLTESIHGTDARGASALGDINCDGYNDFSSYGLDVFLGTANLTPETSFSLITPDITWGYDNNTGLRMVYGDFNGDGYDDIVASDHRWSYFDGDVLLWLGRQNVNGTYDLRLEHPLVADNFGYTKAAGDFNGDGLCDLAVAAPFFWDEGSGHDVTPGKVYIYSGNTTLADTTVGNDDDLAPMTTNNVRIYPNPISRNQPWTNLKLSGYGISRNEKIIVEMFNLKGQMIRTWEKAADDPGSGVYHINCEGMAAGVYIIRARQWYADLGSTRLLIY